MENNVEDNHTIQFARPKMTQYLQINWRTEPTHVIVMPWTGTQTRKREPQVQQPCKHAHFDNSHTLCHSFEFSSDIS